MKWAAVCCAEAQGLKPGDPAFGAWVRLAATPVRTIKGQVIERKPDQGRRGGGRREGGRRERPADEQGRGDRKPREGGPRRPRQDRVDPTSWPRTARAGRSAPACGSSRPTTATNASARPGARPSARPSAKPSASASRGWATSPRSAQSRRIALTHPRDEDGLERQARPQSRLAAGHLGEVLRVERHVQVGGEDGDQRRDQPPAGGAPRRRGHEPQPAGDLGHAAGVDDRVRGREIRRHGPRVDLRDHEVHDAGEDEERAGQEADGAHCGGTLPCRA